DEALERVAIEAPHHRILHGLREALVREAVEGRQLPEELARRDVAEARLTARRSDPVEPHESALEHVDRARPCAGREHDLAGSEARSPGVALQRHQLARGKVAKPGNLAESADLEHLPSCAG